MRDVKLFCGIDWAETHHDVGIIDGDGQLVAKGRIADDPAGLPNSSKCSLLPVIAPRTRCR
jgi:hypothetical protein